MAAWDALAELAEDERVQFEPEPAELDRQFARLLSRLGAAPQLVTDAYLASFAIAAGLGLATFDRGFQRFADLQLHLLP